MRCLIIAQTIAAGVVLAAAMHVNATEMQREHIATFESKPNEQLVPFLKTVGKELKEYTDRTGHEACAAIAYLEETKQYALIVMSDGVSIGCTIREYPQNSVFTGATIHTHPHDKILTIGPRERQWIADNKQSGYSGTTLRNDGSSGFSRVDYQYKGESYLIAKGNLLYKDKSGRTRNEGEIER